MGTIISVLAMILVSVAAAIGWTSAQRRRLPGRRKVLNLATIYNRFYRDSDLELSDVEVAYNRIAEATGVPAGALRPGDRFSDDLAPPKGWEYDDAIFLFSDALEEDADSLGIGVDIEKVATVDDAVRLMKLIRERRARSFSKNAG